MINAKIKFSFSLLLFLCSMLFSSTLFADLADLNKKYLACEIMYQNTGDQVRFKQCSQLVHSLYESEIKQVRSDSGYKNKSKWTQINNQLNEHQIQCESFASKSNINSILNYELATCLHNKYTSLLIEANKM